MSKGSSRRHNQGGISFGLEGVLGGGGSLLDIGLWSILVKLHKLGKIELGLLEDLDLSDHAAVFLKWEDFGRALFLNLFANISFNPVLYENLSLININTDKKKD